MLRDEFLTLLGGQVDPGERERVCGYYAEMIDDRMEAGEDEAEVIAGFGDLRGVVQALEVQRKVRAFNEKPSMSGGAAALIAAVCLFASPVALPLAITLLVLFFTMHVVAFSVLASLVAAMAAVGVAGIAAFVAGIAALFLRPLDGLFAMGAGLVCMGLGLAGAWGTVKLLVLTAKGVWSMWRYCIDKIMRKGGGGNEN